MKISIFMALALALTSTAFAGTIREGLYAEKNYAIMKHISTKEECREVKGKWDSEEGFCFDRADNTVEITKNNDGYKIVVSTISGGNLHTCEFEGEAKLSADRMILTSTVETTDYETDAKTTCTVKVTQKDGFLKKAVSVEEKGNCREFCGANAYGLSIEKAVKIK